MSLSSDLISQFAKITKDEKKRNVESTVYGTIVAYDDSFYVRLDGSDLLTPIVSTAEVREGERVTVLLKNHSATVIGNISSPAAGTEIVTEISTETVSTLIASKASIKDLDAERARINSLVANDVSISQRLTANEADIVDLETANATITDTLIAHEANIETLNANKLDALTASLSYATIENLNATQAAIDELQVNKLDAEEASITYATIAQLEAMDIDVEKLSAISADINDLKANKLDASVAAITYATIEQLDSVDINTETLSAINAEIDSLKTGKLDAEEAAITYANIDFSNIGKAAMEYFYADSGLIENVVVGDSTITGKLVGVTISGDLIEANTLVADKLVIQGEDGLYYKLNTDGVSIEAEQTEYNSLDGSVITAKTITASKISVDDLVAFDATIGGFNITDDSLYSGVKESVDNTTRGVYMDDDGQMAVGDEGRYLKYYRDTDGSYKLAVCADAITFAATGTDLASGVYGIVSGPNIYEMREDIDALEVRVTNAETKIEQTSEAITLSATKAEVSSTLSGYYTKEESDAALTVTADEIASSVSNTYATKSSLATTQSELDSLESRVSTAETSITQNSNAIALRAMKTELETAKSEAISTASSDATTKANNALSSANANTTSLLASYSTTAEMNAAIELESDNITSSVSSTYATKTALATTDSNVTAAQNAADAAQADIDGLTIGGRNLLKDTSDEFKELSMTEDKYYTQFGTDLVLEAGQTYTFSVYVEKTSEDDHTINLHIGCGNKGNYNKDLHSWRKDNIPMGIKTSITYTVKESDVETYKYFSWRLRNEQKVTSIRFKEVKLERGTRATDWSPCPDDTEADIAALDTRVTSAESSITILANSINSNVTETTNLGTRMTSVEQTASGLTTRLTSVESEVDDAAKTATNFANLSDDGLVVANLTNNTLGKNVLIGSDAVTVRTGTTENAVFGGDVIELAKNNESATISMLNGQFKIYYDSDNSDGGFGVYGKTADGQERLAFQPVNEIGNLTLGWGGYDTGENKTNLYGNEINMFAKTGINIYPGEGQFIETSGNVYLPNGRNIFTSNADGDKRSALIMNDSNQLFYGYGSYANSEGDVYYDGNTVNIRSKSSVNINGREYGENQILWSGGSYMSGSQTVTLSANVSDQPNGIVIIFSRYASGAAQNYQFSTHFIPKSQVTSHNGGGHSFLIASDPIFSVIACKYLYISDGQITGHADNTATGTGTSGITYTNNAFVMRYVIGV